MIIARTTIKLFFIAALVFYSYMVSAADFNILPSNGTFGLKQEFGIDIKINSNGQSINAAQAKIKFSPAVLEVKSVSKESSIFNFWLLEPKISNDEGMVEFLGGTPNGVSGASLQVLRIVFISKSIGSSEVTFVDGAITAADGTGANILAQSNGANFAISAVSVVPKLEKTPLLTPVQIERKPVESARPPALPQISVPLYPDSAKWYSIISTFNVSWELSPDIFGVSTAINSNPNFEAPAKSEGLFDSKTFTTLAKDGVYYLHVRFQNNRGWGPTAHHRTALDTQPPPPFDVNVEGGLISDNPSPVLMFETGDSLSGIDKYFVTIGVEEPKPVATGEYKLAPHPPGKHRIAVKALDMAGNSTESAVEIEILPIEHPVILSISRKVIRESNSFLTVAGTALPDSSTIISIQDKSKNLIFESETQTDSEGNWNFQLSQELRAGAYFVTAKTKDNRGAMSLPTQPEKVVVKDKPFISLLGFDITFKNLTVALAIIIIAVSAYYWKKFAVHILKAQRSAFFAGKDLKNIIDQIKKGVENLVASYKKEIRPESKHAEHQQLVQKIYEDLDRADRYLVEEIKRLK